jgi:hypothetical protein
VYKLKKVHNKILCSQLTGAQEGTAVNGRDAVSAKGTGGEKTSISANGTREEKTGATNKTSGEKSSSPPPLVDESSQGDIDLGRPLSSFPKCLNCKCKGDLFIEEY